MEELLDPRFHLLAQIALLGFIAWCLPVWSTPEIFFTVTVPADFRQSDVGRRILTRYRWQVIAVALALATTATALTATTATLGGAVLTLVQLALIGMAVVTARKQVRPHAVPPTTIREASLTMAPQGLPGGWLGQTGPYLLLALTTAILFWHWQVIPQRFVTHWNAQLEADGWADKSALSLLTPILIGVTTCALLTLLGWLMIRNTRRVHAGGQAARLENERRHATAEVLMATGYLIAVVFVLVAFSPLARDGEAARAFAATIASASVFGSLALILWVLVVIAPRYQASRRAAETSAGGPPIGDRTADECWKLGIVYYNPADPSLFVEKRLGIGYTFNFARPAAWVLLVTILIVPLLLLLLL